MPNDQTRGDLDEVKIAALKMPASSSFLYKLSPDTPGVYLLGRKKLICVPELRAWARARAEQRATEPKQSRPRRKKAVPKDAA